MKPNHFLRGWFTGIIFLNFFLLKGQDVVPCMIFSGNSDCEQSLDLSKFNRIVFEDNYMIVSSSSDKGEEEVKLQYSLFNHLEVGNVLPSDLSLEEAVIVDGESQLIFKSDSKELLLESVSDSIFTIDIFNLDGRLVKRTSITANRPILLRDLSMGVYIAIASDGIEKLVLKFLNK